MVVLVDAVKSAPTANQSPPHQDNTLMPLEVEPAKVKCDKSHQRPSRRSRIWLRLAATFFMLLLVKLYLLLKMNEKDLEYMTSLLDIEQEHFVRHRFHAIDVILGPKKSEDLFLSIPNAKDALAASRKYATHPHLAGSQEDLEDAKVLLELFQTQFGIPVPESEPIFPAGTHKSRHATLNIPKLTNPQAWIDMYYPVMNLPLDRSLEIVDDSNVTLWAADLVEDGDPRDPEAAKYKDSVPTWHGLSFGGEAVGKLIYVDYGRKEDYDKLVELGVDFKGKIAIARYGAIFRGLKVKFAQELGAVGVLIYSDPRDDGSVTVENGYEPYPAGPARNPTSVQRGSVMFLSIYPGDPSTPGYPAYENSTRAEGGSIPKIPSLPISWENAERLLEEIEDGVERSLSGKLSKRKVKIVNHVDDKVTPIWNTMAVIPGHIRDEVVLIGNHRDAWVMGAADPTSGTVSLHEIIRGYGALLRSGWKPLRTILFASWDAEEYGLIGSTEWGEDFANWIQEHVVTYLNLDSSVSGSAWRTLASPSLAHLIRNASQEVILPQQADKSLWDSRSDIGPFKGPMDKSFEETLKSEHAKKLSMSASTGVGPLGSGSDYTVFLQRLGVASTDEGFSRGSSDAVYHYHSIYDSQHWQETYADPTFEKHVAAAKHLGLLGLRVVDSIVLPLNTSQYALELDDYLDVVESLAASLSPPPDLSRLRKSIKHLQKTSVELDEEKVDAEKKFKELLEKMRRIIDDCPRWSRHGTGWYTNAKAWFQDLLGLKGPDNGLHGPMGKSTHHDHHFDLLIGDVFSDNPVSEDMLKDSVFSHTPVDLEKKFPTHKFIRAARRLRKVNKKLATFEQGFISKEGIKDREWYKHLVVAPGKNLGYGATTLPALTEALTIEKNTTLAEHEAHRLKQLIDKLAKHIEV